MKEKTKYKYAKQVKIIKRMHKTKIRDNNIKKAESLENNRK